MTTAEINATMEAFNVAADRYWRVYECDGEEGCALAIEAAQHAMTLFRGIDNEMARKRWKGNADMWLRTARFRLDKAKA